MRGWAAAIATAGLLVAAGCGYVGPIVPPSPMIPVAVTDLSAVERGDQLVISFTLPNRTTDEFAIRSFSTVDLRIGSGSPASGKDYDLPVRTATVQYSIPAADWAGQQVSLAVRTAIKQDKHYSAWSNTVRMTVISPLTRPVVSVVATAQGYKLTWEDEGEGVHYEVFRKGQADAKPVQIGTTDKPEFVDGGAQYGLPYTYSVIARSQTAESPFSEPVTKNDPDTFPPAVPTGLVSATTADAVELSWDRNTESDLKGYLVYRAVEGGTFAPIGQLTALPTYSDHTVEHGKTYSYRVSAVDQTGNASAQSSPVSANFP